MFDIHALLCAFINSSRLMALSDSAFDAGTVSFTLAEKLRISKFFNSFNVSSLTTKLMEFFKIDKYCLSDLIWLFASDKVFGIIELTSSHTSSGISPSKSSKTWSILNILDATWFDLENLD